MVKVFNYRYILCSIVTSIGRSLIEQSKDYAENHFNKFIKDNNLLYYLHKLTFIFYHLKF